MCQERNEPQIILCYIRVAILFFAPCSPAYLVFYVSGISPLGNRLCRIQDLHGHFPGSGNAGGLVQASLSQFCARTTDCQHRWKNPQGIPTVRRGKLCYCH